MITVSVREPQPCFVIRKVLVFIMDPVEKRNLRSLVVDVM